MVVEEAFENIIYPGLKEYLIENSNYSPIVTKAYTEQSKVFPIVIVNLNRVINNYGNLTYGEENYPFRIDINIYANDKTIDIVESGVSTHKKVSKITIASEISGLVETYFKTNFRVTVNRQDDIDNIDGSIRRNFIRISGIFDTKFGEGNYVIYPQ